MHWAETYFVLRCGYWRGRLFHIMQEGAFKDQRANYSNADVSEFTTETMMLLMQRLRGSISQNFKVLLSTNSLPKWETEGANLHIRIHCNKYTFIRPTSLQLVSSPIFLGDSIGGRISKMLKQLQITRIKADLQDTVVLKTNLWKHAFVLGPLNMQVGWYLMQWGSRSTFAVCLKNLSTLSIVTIPQLSSIITHTRHNTKEILEN